MSAVSTIFVAARADFLERVRSFRFLVLLAATIGVGLLMLPTLEDGYVVLEVGQGRGVYGSAWVGLVFGVVGATILPLFGFFIVKDALARDRQSRVGLLLAASPFGRFDYLFAKMLSNLGIFVAILAVSSVVALAMQLWRAEDTAVHLVDLLVPLWLVPLPVLTATASVALLFECVPGLRGAFGNVAFFFLWVGVIGPGLDHMTQDNGRIVTRGADFYGISAPLADFEDHLPPDPKRTGGLSIGANIGAIATPVAWEGIAGDGRWLLDRALWMLASLPILLLAALFFDRFDPARGRWLRGRAAKTGPAVDVPVSPSQWHALTPLPRIAPNWRPLTQLRAELILLVKRRPLWWYGGVIGFWIAGLANLPADAVKWVVPLAWLWGITGFSEHGARAQIHGLQSLLASAPAPLLRQLPVQWLACVLYALLLVAPVLAKLVLTGALGLAAQVVVGAGFVAALTLALGALSGGSRLFELCFLMLWYASMQNAPGARFGGNPDLGFAASQAPSYFAVSVSLLALAWLLRALALRR